MQVNKVHIRQAPGLRRLSSPSSEPAPADRFVRSEILQPHPLPRFAPKAAIDQVASKLESIWEKRIPNPRSTIGLIVERGWKPAEEHDEVLNIADAIMDSGGRPKLLYIGRGEVKTQMAGIDGLAVPGGRDVDPSKYGMKRGPGMAASSPDPAFDDFEISAIQNAYDTGMPLLGHCRGEQIMNVAGGGTLTQDLPTEHVTPEGFGSKYGTEVNHRPESVRHHYDKRVNGAHLIYIEPDTRLHEIAGDSLEWVNSIHHQAAHQISDLLEVVAYGMDGVPESVQRKGKPWQVGHQFHAEAMRYTDPKFQKVYDFLVDDAAKFRSGELK